MRDRVLAKKAIIRQILPAVLALSIVSLIIFAPAAQAVTVEITGIQAGQQIPQDQPPINLEIRISIPTGEIVPFSQVNIILDQKVISFTLTGVQIVAAGGVKEEVIPSLVLLTPPPGQLFTSEYGYQYGFLQGYGFTQDYGYFTNTYGYGFGWGGAAQIVYQATLYPFFLKPGPHTIRADIVTGMSPQPTFSSATISFTILPPGSAQIVGSDFSLGVSQFSFNIPPGGDSAAAQSFVTITSFNQFADTVSFTFNAPPGITAELDAKTVFDTYNLAADQSIDITLLIKVASNVPPGMYSAFLDSVGQSSQIRHGAQIFVNVGVAGVASLSIQPPLASPGTFVTFFTTGFQEGESITLELQLPDGTFETITPQSYVDGNTVVTNGVWGATVTVPPEVQPGKFGIKAIGQTSGKTAFAELLIVTAGADDFFISISPRFLDFAPGDTRQIQINIQSIGNFESQVTVQVQACPPFIKVDSTACNLYSATRTPPKGGNAPPISITISIGSEAPPDFFPIQIVAQGGGIFHQEFVDISIHPPSGFFEQFDFGSVTLSPNYGTAGSTVTISGAGFPPSKPLQNDGANSFIYFGRDGVAADKVVLSGIITTDSNGGFSTQFTVPNFAPGRYPVHVTVDGRKGVADYTLISGAASFILSTSPTFLEPIAPGETTSLTVTASSLNSKASTVTLSVQGLPPSITTTFGTSSLSVSSGGTASTTLTITASATAMFGPYDFTVKGTYQSEEQFVHVPFGVRPPDVFFDQFGFASIMMTPNFGAAGDTVTIRGSGFGTGDTTLSSITFGMGSAAQTITFSPAVQVSSGSFTAIFKVPAGIPQGEYPVQVTAAGRTAVEPFFVISTVGSFRLTVSPAFLPPVPQGGSATLTVSVSSINQQTPTVTLSAFGLPPEITATFDTTSLTLGKGETKTATLTLTVDQFAPPGPYPFVVSGEADGEIFDHPIGFGVMPGAGFGLANIILSPDFGAAGDKVTISGAGFGTGTGSLTSIQFGPCRIDFSPAVTVTNGEFTATIKVPPSDGTGCANAPVTIGDGMHPVSVSANGFSDTKPFTIVSSTAKFRAFVSPPFVGPIQQESSATTQVTVESVNNQEATVTLSVHGLPPEVTYSFTGGATTKTLSVGPGLTNATTLTITIGKFTPPGPYDAVITASEAGGDVFNIPFGIGVAPKIGAGLGNFASIFINPDFVQPGEQVTISGHGFTPTATISLAARPPGAPTFTPITLGTTITVPADGSWSVSTTVPNVSPGFYEIKASDGTLDAFAPINIVPAVGGDEFFFMELSPPFLSVTQGSSSDTTLTINSVNQFTSQVTFDVEGLPPGVSVTFINDAGTTIGKFTGTGFRNIVEVAPVAQTPPAGESLKVTVRVAAATDSPIGPMPIFIRAQVVGGESKGHPLGVMIAPSVAEAFINLDSFDGPVSTKVSITGSGFTGSETIVIKFAGSTIATVPSTITATNGEFTASITIPSGTAPGLYPIEAEGQTSGSIARVPFMVIPSFASSFIFFANPPEIAVSLGSSGTMSLTLDPIGTYAEATSISLRGLPAGVTYSLSPTSPVTPTVGTPVQITLTINIPAALAPGFYPFTITASSDSDFVDIFATIRVTSTDPDFELLALPPSLGAPAGGTASTTILIRGFNAFSNAVTLTASNLPTGVTATFASTGTATGSKTPSATTGVARDSLTLTIGSTATPGNYLITVSGTDGTLTHQEVIHLGIAPSGVTIVQYTPPPVSPSRITPRTPFPIKPPWGDEIQLNSLVSSLSESVIITPKNIPTPPTNLAPLPPGTTGIFTRVTSIEPSASISKMNGTIKFTYTDAELQAAGITDETTVKIAFLNPSGEWETVLTTVDPATNTATATITHFSQWTLLGAPTAPEVPVAILVPQVTANLLPRTVTLAPGSSVTITLRLTADQVMTTGYVTFNIPQPFKVSSITTTAFAGTTTQIGNLLRIDKTTIPNTQAATITFTLTAPLDGSVQIGETYNLSIEVVSISGQTVKFTTPESITITIVKPTVTSIFNALDSYFDKKPSIYTENRVPTAKDILNLLDFYFSGKV